MPTRDPDPLAQAPGKLRPLSSLSTPCGPTKLPPVSPCFTVTHGLDGLGENGPGRALEAWPGKDKPARCPRDTAGQGASPAVCTRPMPPQACVQTTLHQVGLACEQTPSPSLLVLDLLPSPFVSAPGSLAGASRFCRIVMTHTDDPQTPAPPRYRVWALAPATPPWFGTLPGAMSVPPGTSWAAEGPAMFTVEPLATIHCLVPPDSTLQLHPDPEPPAPTPHLVT